MTIHLQGYSHLPDAGDAKAQLRRVQQALAFLEANFASKLTIEQLARISGLSLFHFSRLFHRVVGLPPYQYLLRCRLRHAQELLSASTSSPSIADIAIVCGFADQAHLTRLFRRAFGVTPQQFRRTQTSAGLDKKARKNVL